MKTSIITLAISLLPFLSYADEWMVEKDGITYVSYDEATCYAKTADKSITEAIIPSEIEGRKVTSIGELCFNKCYYLECVSIPNTVQTIEGASFYLCSSLLELTIPESVTSIDDEAFFLCRCLKSYKVASDNPYYCSVDGVLYTKDMSKLHSYPQDKPGVYVIPEGVKELGYLSFYFNQTIESITLPTTLEAIPNWCFQACNNLKELTFPEGCQLKEIGDYSFSGCGLRGALVLPNRVEKLGTNCFSGCVHLTSLWLPQSINQFYSGFEFYDCWSLDEVHVQSTEPCQIYRVTFGWDKKITIPRYLYVPKGCREKYEAEPSWSTQFFILEEGQDRSEAGIEDVQADALQDGPAYDLMGRVRHADAHNEILIKNGRKIVIR